jgi:Cu/Ag efflux protein CusF
MMQRRITVRSHSLPSLTGQIVKQEWRGTTLVLSLIVLTACAAYVPPPLTMAHPAHPDAVSAPEPPPSKTLAYERSDLPSTQPAVAMAPRGASGTPASTSDVTAAVVGEGKVIAVVPNSSQIVVDHKAIKGFMDAMTMGYQVAPPSLLEGFKAGDEIRFTIDPNKNVIVKIEPYRVEGFVGEGNVVAVVPDTQQVVIEHGDIKGFMNAMTMGFRVASPALLEGLKAGDRVRFTIGAQEKAIIQIEKMGK